MIYTNMFTLNGYGYLTGIDSEKGLSIARFKTIYESPQDEIWMECEIQGLVKEKLFNLLNEVKKGHIVIMTFKTGYRKFINASSCTQPEDPDHIVTLRCKLLELGDSFIDGCPVGKNYFRFLAAA